MMVGDETWCTDVARQLAERFVSLRKPLLLYLEFAEGWSGGSIFADEGNRIISLSLQADLWAGIYSAWERLEDGKRWSVMQLTLEVDGTFTVGFVFPEEIEVGEISLDNHREIAAARAAFGDKPIHYPPMPDHAFHLSDDRPGFDTPLG